MPERDPVREPELVATYWIGEQEMGDAVKNGLKELAQRFPNAPRELRVLPPRHPGPTGRQQWQELMEGYARDAGEQGYRLVHLPDIADKLAHGLDRTKYTSDTLKDIYGMEAANAGHISTKDLSFYLGMGAETGLHVDLSHHHMRDSEWEAVQRSPNFNPAAVAPIDFSTAELKIVDLSHGEDALIRNPLSSEYQSTPERFDAAGIEPEYVRHLDAFAVYAREGTRGQQFGQAAANQYIGYLAKMAQDEVSKQNVAFRDQDGHTRFRPTRITLTNDNLLAAKYNPGDPRREDIIGRMNINAAIDAAHLVYGRPRTPDSQGPGRAPRVDPQVWDAITMQAFEVNGARVLPQLGLTKVSQNSWRSSDQRDPMDLGKTLAGDKVTLVQATNMGVAEAARAASNPGLSAASRAELKKLSEPSRIPYEVRYSSSADNSPRRTPSPAGEKGMSVEQLRQDVANMSMPRTPSPERPNASANVAAQPTHQPVKRSATGPRR
ncbi:hypothetical protein [Streptomyces reniochalinae]|uniref:Uncharacterized protein n=1 Tax=Streptomyces reniochalinae TaxID=2250578 RepID=A0A367EJI2_9ACTN|nr:hypothetical protein [Streptomyces reniochalinae]RCG18123.1 hypothetical protein DQ392_15820 [Streptomyces reniochalinae]